MEQDYGLIPRPLHVEAGSGSFALKRAVQLSPIPPELKSEEAALKTVCAEAGWTLDGSADAPALTLACDQRVSHAEGYELEITDQAITLRASTPTGIFYALQSLRQLISVSEKSGALPACRIEDSPAHEWRGLMLDTARNYFTLPFIKKILDMAALHRLNRFHWHITDDQGWRLPVEGYPLLTEIGSKRRDQRMGLDPENEGSFYTEAEITEIVAYAAERHITVVPEVDAPGHMLACLASYPGLGCTGGPYRVEDRFGVFPDVLCAGNPEIFTLMEAVFDTLCRLFPGPYVHIGGDECPRIRWEHCPKCQKKIQELGLNSAEELQPWITARLVQMLEERGKTVIGWDEVLDGADPQKLPASLIVQSWRGIEGGIKAAQAGLKAIMSPESFCYLNKKPYNDSMEIGRLGTVTVRQTYDFTPIPEGLTAQQAGCIIGGQANLWAETIYEGRTAEYLLFPRLAAISESLWLSEDKKDFASFTARLPAYKRTLRKRGLLYYDGPLE